ncbi:MAG TPA: c-type cytochrome [Leucothrix sp.]|nr:c-type cytochrome [Leucothrix sp.]
MNLKNTTFILLFHIAFLGALTCSAQEIEENSYSPQDLITSAENIKKLFDLEKHTYDKLIGDEINQVCAGCHKEFGIGGSDGKYPRIAGLPVSYIIKEIVFFRERHRPNIAMVEHVEERQLSNDEVMDIAIFLNNTQLKNRLSVIDETAADFDAYARLQEAKSILQIGKTEGNIKKGKKLYRKECKSCHGKKGEGDQKDATPMLAGQHQKYLWRQIDLYIKGKRLHDEDDPEEEFLKSFSKDQLKDIFAYISILDD